MNEIDEHMDHAGRQLQAMLAAALAIAQAVAERRDRAVRDAARQAGGDAQEMARRAQVDRLTQAATIPTAAEVAGRGPLSDHPARTTTDIAHGLRSTDPAAVATAWAAHTTAGGIDDPGGWDDALRAAGADPERARADAARIKGDVVDPALASRAAAQRVEDLTAARVAVTGDQAVDRAVSDDHTAVLEQLYGTGWADRIATAGQDGAGTGEQSTSSGPAEPSGTTRGQLAGEATGAWQHGAEAPRLAGLAQTTRAGRSSLPGRAGSQLRPGQAHRTQVTRQQEHGLDR